jgi:hypothetical protein
MSKQSKSNQSPTHEEIAARAHRLYETEGRPEGKAMQHWLQAESQLSAERKNQSAQAQKTAEAKSAPASAATPPNTQQRNPKSQNSTPWQDQPARRPAVQHN